MRIVKKIILWYFGITIGLVVLLKFLPVYVTPLMIKRTVESVFEGKMPKNDKKWVPIERINPKMVRAVIASEDNLFLQHKGFSFDHIKKAYEYNKRGKRLRGGSTISQQTAKNVFTFGTRTWVRKGFEAYFTVLIELIWGKERIMEVYLNVVELGKGVYGVEAASQTYFHKSSAKLKNADAAILAAALPNPRRYSVANPGPYMRRRQALILRLMPKMGKISFD